MIWKKETKRDKKRQSKITAGKSIQRVSSALVLLGLVTVAIISIVSGWNQVQYGYVAVINFIGVGLMVIGLLTGLISSVIVSSKISKTRKQ